MLTVEHTQALDKYMAIKTQYTDAMIRWKESRYFTKFSDLQKVFETNLALNKEELVYQPFEREERKLTPQEIDETEMENVVKYLDRSEEHTSELQSQSNLVCRLLL